LAFTSKFQEFRVFKKVCFFILSIERMIISNTAVEALIMTTHMAEALLVGQQIKAARRAAGLTVEQLADLLGTSVPSIKKLERGEAVVQFTKLSRLARALRTTPDALLGFPPSVGFERIRPVLRSLMVVLNIGPQKEMRILEELEDILFHQSLVAPGVDEASVLQVVAEAKFREILKMEHV
jgi:transcriptional regulator with XRE-family HTH domain